MIRAMYSGISGLKVNQTKLDVVGNNIANVGTTGFKNQRIRFQDMLSQNVREATGPGANTGGTNPSQVGLGVQVAGIDTVVTQGSMQPTSRNLDFAVDGDGYFIIGRGANDAEAEIKEEDHTIDGGDMGISFTRDGSFTLDEEGNLLTSDGLRIMGYKIDGADINHTDDGVTIKFADADGAKAKGDLVALAIPDKVTDTDDKERRVKSFSVDKNGLIKAVLDNDKVAALGQIAMASFKNPAGLTKQGKNLYGKSANSGDAVVRTGVGTAGDDANDKGYGDILQGKLEMSNVDLAEQFTEMIVASRAFQANGKIISTSDEILQTLVNLKR